MTTIQVRTDKPYEVRIERGLLARAGEQLAAMTDSRTVAVIADDTVDRLYGGTVERSLTGAGFRVVRRSFPHGETNKNLQVYGELLNALAENRLTRADTVVALGGGVTGDMAGFAAATYLRGVRLVQMPTTLLAMVDSSVGGKTAVDLPAGKNLVGAFWQPSLVLCDPDALDTLDSLADGTAEAIKHGVLASEALFDTLAGGDWHARVEEIVAENVRIKARFVAGDEHDRGLRQMLNLGHTLGHGVEKLSGYTVPHGHAVAIGMVYAARIAVHMGLCGRDVVERITDALARNGLPVSAPYPADALADAALGDKKRMGDTLTLVLPKGIGECALTPVSVCSLPELARIALND